MIVVDTSALIAIIEGEKDAPIFARAIAEADPPFISAGTLIEAGIVVFNRYGVAGGRLLDEMIIDGGFRIESVTAHQAQLAREAYGRYGKGPKKKGLNYGDCFSYALAKATDLPLLFKGEDFPLTDVDLVLPL